MTCTVRVKRVPLHLPRESDPAIPPRSLSSMSANCSGRAVPTPMRPTDRSGTLGSNSLDLMELRLLLGRHFGTDIGTSFFFTHPTPAAIAVQLAAPELPREMPRPPRAIAAETTADAARFADSGAIAVVGMACRFPGGISDTDTFWRVLRDGIDCITQVPSRRWDADALTATAPATPGRINSRYGGFLTDVDRFDGAFFGIGRREAMLLDPQQRLLLETSWEALEHAGLDARRLAGGNVGVYVGLISHDYEMLQLRGRALREHGIYFWYRKCRFGGRRQVELLL